MNNGSTLYSHFNGQIEESNTYKIIFDQIIKLRKMKIFKIIIVEGKDDLRIYQNYVKKRFNYEFEKIGFVVAGSKDSILKVIEDTLNGDANNIIDYALKHNNTVTIIDKDYQDLTNEIVFSENQLKRLNVFVTSKYSIENYFFTQDSLNTIFKNIIKVNDKEYEIIMKLFYNFFCFIKNYEYCSLIRTLSRKKQKRMCCVDLFDNKALNQYNVNLRSNEFELELEKLTLLRKCKKEIDNEVSEELRTKVFSLLQDISDIRAKWFKTIFYPIIAKNVIKLPSFEEIENKYSHLIDLDFPDIDKIFG